MGGFICTLIGVIGKACADAITGGGGGDDRSMLVQVLFTGLAVILTAIGVLITVIPAKPGKKKLIVLGIHAAIWVVGYFLLKILIPIVIGGVLLVVVLSFLGIIHPLSAIGSAAGGTSQEEQFYQPPAQEPYQPREEVEVWQKQENGNMKRLQVNSSGDMYKDPDTGEWTSIKKK